jgi:hypothetical protein
MIYQIGKNNFIFFSNEKNEQQYRNNLGSQKTISQNKKSPSNKSIKTNNHISEKLKLNKLDTSD